MSGAVHSTGSTLRRVIVVRQVNELRWKVEAYERQARGWRFTWLLNPDDTESGARWIARILAQRTGLPVGEQRIGERVRLIDGVLGKVA